MKYTDYNFFQQIIPPVVIQIRILISKTVMWIRIFIGTTIMWIRILLGTTVVLIVTSLKKIGRSI